MTKKQIDEAIWALEIEASGNDDPYLDSLQLLSRRTAEKKLAYAAWDAVFKLVAYSDIADWPAIAAEAACLLRDGWIPGDPVTRLKPRSS